MENVVNNQGTENVAENQGTVVEGANAENVGAEQQQTEKMFTQAELDKRIQQESDKRVNSALEKAKAKWRAEYEEQLAKEKSEAERLAKMTSEERQQEELKKLKSEFDNERAEFETQRQAFEMERMKMQLTKELHAVDVPIEFADFLLAKDAETTKANMDAFVSMWNSTLQAKIDAHVESRLKGKSPKQSSGGNMPMTKEEFVRLPYPERAKMLKENPEMVNEILKQGK